MQKAAASEDSVAQTGHFFMGTSRDLATLAGKVPSLTSEVNPHGEEKGTEAVAKRSRVGFDHAKGHSVVNSLGFDAE
jgi:hypothetical protein